MRLRTSLGEPRHRSNRPVLLRTSRMAFPLQMRCFSADLAASKSGQAVCEDAATAYSFKRSLPRRSVSRKDLIPVANKWQASSWMQHCARSFACKSGRRNGCAQVGGSATRATGRYLVWEADGSERGGAFLLSVAHGVCFRKSAGSMHAVHDGYVTR